MLKRIVMESGTEEWEAMQEMENDGNTEGPV